MTCGQLCLYERCLWLLVWRSVFAKILRRVTHSHTEAPGLPTNGGGTPLAVKGLQFLLTLCTRRCGRLRSSRVTREDVGLDLGSSWCGRHLGDSVETLHAAVVRV
ncbi:hypothetical protein PF008_g10222 [Phytophthora fragariae]|uniref:Secreted protein n=1 Tax=Phytophthora fragariae TaxID=53985 RepID=A0A6G0RUW6_9STRA|nr:hypothetical protein PF008_g10222 [Phytophthora fragariae]